MKSYKINPGDEFIYENGKTKWKIISLEVAVCVVGGEGWSAGEWFGNPIYFYQRSEWSLVKSYQFKSLYKKLSQD